ncbi:MAG: type II toxin-antitoxin system VapC family toxin [Intrasporangium sp.]|uniref:type II toxin-antitoxin system VapC family toxin n=1 Tax=Intrasporangium sp. TaxID=1925024 RepID=UPI002648BDA9|nr:type II toxin-antitoxin system VapC family toxin [Intrasporangium sp.]MDN5794575.1 type II toxin-antitoxin system VapC family toxin [Intrasporangium sp.]
MPEAGILDTSVVIDLPGIDGDRLPAESAITAVTLAELAAGPHAVTDVIQRSIRQERLQWAEATFDALPFDIAAARSYGRVYAHIRAARRRPRGRLADLMIASIAAANQLPLYTRNPTDFAGLEPLITVVTV